MQGIRGLAGGRQTIHDERSTYDRCGECQSIEHYSNIDAALFQCWQTKEREKVEHLDWVSVDSSRLESRDLLSPHKVHMHGRMMILQFLSQIIQHLQI